MPDEEKQGGSVTEIAKVVGAIVDKVPVYQDAVQPAAKEIGRGLEIVAKAVNTALLPVEGLIWGIDQIKDFVRKRVAEKLRKVPPENIQAPAPHVAVPAIEALRYTGADTDLSELYANLLASSMDRATASRAHPAFVDMIKNMSPDEARLMRYLGERTAIPIVNIQAVDKENGSYLTLSRYVTTVARPAGCEHIALMASYFDNLERLGLIDIDLSHHIAAPDAYKELEELPEIKALVAGIETANPKTRGELHKICVTLTDLGRMFIDTCVTDKTEVRGPAI